MVNPEFWREAEGDGVLDEDFSEIEREEEMRRKREKGTPEEKAEAKAFFAKKEKEFLEETNKKTKNGKKKTEDNIPEQVGGPTAMIDEARERTVAIANERRETVKKRIEEIDKEFKRLQEIQKTRSLTEEEMELADKISLGPMAGYLKKKK